jgi:methyl-accepting chemotaxis protein
VGEIDEVSVAIAAAMEEQSVATQEISRSVSQAAIAAANSLVPRVFQNAG